MSHRQRDTHTVEVTRPSDSDGETDWMGAPVQDDDEAVVTLLGRLTSPVEAGNLGRDSAGELVSSDKVFWTTDSAAAQVAVDDHVTLTDATGAADAGTYLVANIREHYGRRTAAPDMHVFDLMEFSGT